jgi:hypothetical protein
MATNIAFMAFMSRKRGRRRPGQIFFNWRSMAWRERSLRSL